MLTLEDVAKAFELYLLYGDDEGITQVVFEESGYEGCRNCRHQPQPMQMCEWGKKRDHIELICSGWEKKDEVQKKACSS